MYDKERRRENLKTHAKKKIWKTRGCTGFKGPGARITAAFPIDRLQDRYCSQSQAHNLSAAPVVFDCVALPGPGPRTVRSRTLRSRTLCSRSLNKKKKIIFYH